VCVEGAMGSMEQGHRAYDPPSPSSSKSPASAGGCSDSLRARLRSGNRLYLLTVLTVLLIHLAAQTGPLLYRGGQNAFRVLYYDHDPMLFGRSALCLARLATRCRPLSAPACPPARLQQPGQLPAPNAEPLPPTHPAGTRRSFRRPAAARAGHAGMATAPGRLCSPTYVLKTTCRC
jgi:hypothetical protein